jgi:succinyldiaminopimelate transaminase
MRLPDFPWDVLAPYGERAGQHPDGAVDLSIGTPVDPVPEVVQAALRAASDTPGYPTTAGTPDLQDAIGTYLARRCKVTAAIGVLPTIGSKELVAWLPTLLGVAAGGTVLVPALAYPTYAVGAVLAGAQALPYESLTGIGPRRVELVWVNSPSNPTGQVLPAVHLRKLVDWARERGTVLVSDECYLEFGWEAEPASVLDPSVCDGDPTGLLVVHSLSKRSNLAGYRAGFVAGDPALVAGLLAVRKQAGMMVPRPVQAAMVAALRDEGHVVGQRSRYAARRDMLRPVLEKAGFAISHSEAGLYLWATREEDCWRTVGWLAERGILAAPGSFYGAAGGQHVRFALTATD